MCVVCSEIVAEVRYADGMTVQMRISNDEDCRMITIQVIRGKSSGVSIVVFTTEFV